MFRYLLGLAAAVTLLFTLRPAHFHATRWAIARQWRRASKAFVIATSAFLYALLVLPFAAIARLLGRDALRLRRKGGAKSYWTVYAPAPSGGMKEPF